MHNHRHGHWTVGTLVCVPVCSVMPDSSRPRGMEPTRLLCPWRFSSQNYGAGLPGPPPGDLPNPGIFPTQGSNPGLPHCRWILYQLSHKEILEWVAYSFSSGIPLTQESNQSLLHCRQILYQLSFQGRPINCTPIKIKINYTPIKMLKRRKKLKESQHHINSIHLDKR